MKPGERRRNRVQIGFTDAELAALEASAAKARVPVATLVHDLAVMALRKKPPARKH